MNTIIEQVHIHLLFKFERDNPSSVETDCKAGQIILDESKYILKDIFSCCNCSIVLDTCLGTALVLTAMVYYHGIRLTR